MTMAPQQTGGGSTKATGPGAFQIRSLGSVSHVPFLNLMVYAKHGAGKTTLAGSAVDVPEMQDVLAILAEGGEIVFEDNDMIDNPEGIDVVKVDRIEQVQKLYEFLKAHISLRDNPEREEQLQKLQEQVFGGFDGRIRRYRTVILDSLTEIEAYNLAKILDLDSLGLDAGDDMEVAGFPQFRKNNHIIQRMVRQFRDLDINFIATCAQAFGQDERKAYHYHPKLTGQLSNIVQGFFDVVGWMVVGNKPSENEPGPRRLFVQPQSTPKADAKNRLAAYKGDYFDNPTMKEIMEKVGFLNRKKK